jgi:hypothetical protein
LYKYVAADLEKGLFRSHLEGTAGKKNEGRKERETKPLLAFLFRNHSFSRQTFGGSSGDFSKLG